MPVPLLTTKLYIPPARPNLVPRPRLVEQLNAGLRKPLTLISAPAGYGKTTLISEWRAGAGCDFPLAWVTLDKDDNDPVRFLTYSIAALQTLASGVGDFALSALQTPQPQEPKTILTSLVNDLAVIDKSFALALDDYHVIESRPIHEALSFLLDHLPERMHLLILTRADPPLPLSRLRARDQLAELRLADLCFSRDEAILFLNQVMGLALSVEQVEALELRTEGWIAGLQLAALSMQGRQDIQGFVSAFTGSHHYIVDYLADEVLHRQPEALRDFLLKTSILDRMNGALCDALTGSSGGQSVLEQLDHANLFLIPLDDEQRWYRYHHLFAEVLQSHLQRLYPVDIPGLHRRAADWLEQNELVPEAMGHALASGDLEQAAMLAEFCAPSMLQRGELKMLVGWMNRLPEEVVQDRPRLCISYAGSVALSAGQPETVERYLQYAEQALQSDASVADAQDLLGQIASIRANMAVFLGDNRGAIQLCAQALKQLSERNTGMRAYTALMQADASWTLGEGVAARMALEEAVELSRAAGDMQTALTSMNYLARLLVAHGHLRQAQEVYQSALRLTAEQGGGRWPSTGVIYVGLGLLLWEQNDAGSAMRYLTEGVGLAAMAQNVDSLLFGYTTLARIYQASGEVDQALVMIEKAERVALETHLARDRYRVAARQAGLMLAKGDIEGAARWSQELTDSVEEYSRSSALPPLSPLRISEQIMRARVLIAQFKTIEAMQLLSSLLGPLDAAGRSRSVIEVLALQAIAFQAQGKETHAMTALSHALLLAEPEGYVRLFVDVGKPMAQLLQRMRAEDRTLKEYIRKLLAAFEMPEPQPAPVSPRRETTAGHPFVEPLSTRELEVLRLISTGCSNKEIAGQLVIAVGTVKRHISNIFNKLGVDNRTGAVARARELGLL